MRRIGFVFLTLGIVVLAAGSYFILIPQTSTERTRVEIDSTANDDSGGRERNPIEKVATNLSVPWGIAILPNGELLATERTGTLVHIGRNGDERRITLEAAEAGEGGALGIALHPLYEENHFLYIYTTEQTGSDLINRVTRYRYDSDGHELSEPTTIIDDIPGANYHDGGRIAFGPDRYLYITTGDAGVASNAQDTNSLAGKILRLEDDGSIPDDNPFGNAVWSYGHRNPQGLAWDSEERLWSTEHGRSGLRSGFDELNLIERGGNYGWPEIQGDEASESMITPVRHSGSSTTWAPASLAHLNGRLYWGGLRGVTLYSATIDSEGVSDFSEHFVGEFGRIRTVAAASDSAFYVTTSNTDGRGEPRDADDLLLRVELSALE